MKCICTDTTDEPGNSSSPGAENMKLLCPSTECLQAPSEPGSFGFDIFSGGVNELDLFSSWNLHSLAELRPLGLGHEYSMTLRLVSG